MLDPILQATHRQQKGDGWWVPFEITLLSGGLNQNGPGSKSKELISMMGLTRLTWSLAQVPMFITPGHLGFPPELSKLHRSRNPQPNNCVF